jgi:protein involved in polysaccharide export with SLBB domain
MNTVQAIALAGGYTYRAFKEKFVVTRENGRKIVATSATPIFAGDTIEVYERYY